MREEEKGERRQKIEGRGKKNEANPRYRWNEDSFRP